MLYRLGREMNVSYAWAGDYGLLAEIHGAVRYLAENNKTYIKPLKPHHADAQLLSRSPTAAQIRTFTNNNYVLKADYAVVQGF